MDQTKTTSSAMHDTGTCTRTSSLSLVASVHSRFLCGVVYVLSVITSSPDIEESVCLRSFNVREYSLHPARPPTDHPTNGPITNPPNHASTRLPHARQRCRPEAGKLVHLCRSVRLRKHGTRTAAARPRAESSPDRGAQRMNRGQCPQHDIKMTM